MTTNPAPSTPPLSAGKPGASATRRAAAIRRQELPLQHRRARWLVPLAALGGYFITQATDALLSTPAPITVAVALLPPAAVARRIYQAGPEVGRWRQGADGERRTARLLAPLTRRSGWTVLHDLAIIGVRAGSPGPA